MGNIHPVGGEMDRLPDSHLLALFQGKVEDSLGIHDESHAFRRHSEGTENRPENHGKKYDSHGKEPHPADGSCNGKHGVQLLRGMHLVQGFPAEYLPALFVPAFSGTLWLRRLHCHSSRSFSGTTAAHVSHLLPFLYSTHGSAIPARCNRSGRINEKRTAREDAFSWAARHEYVHDSGVTVWKVQKRFCGPCLHFSTHIRHRTLLSSQTGREFQRGRFPDRKDPSPSCSCRILP